jgi:methionine synthase II (cobalamin-independent)
MPFEPRGLATAIGSLPHRDPEAACDVILENIPEIPFWPQLPGTDFREGMEIQYTEGLPCTHLDEEKRLMSFKTGGEITAELEIFYENYLADNLDHFKISPGFSRGLYAMEKRLREQRPSGLQYFKNQVTGPVTLGLGRVDEQKRAIYYNEIFRDVVVKSTEMKARWLLRRFQHLGCPQICFIDEPILSAFGSSTYVSVQRDDVVRQLGAVIEAVHKENGLAGIHCCGNTEWTILVDAGVDIISFDAYLFGETIAYYPAEVKAFLERGGILAWGIVPSSDAILRESPESLVRKLNEGMDNLAGKGIGKDLIRERLLITPSCGTGSLTPELAERIFKTLREVSHRVRNS